VSIELTARMLLLGKVASDRDDAGRRVRAAIASGEALDRFRRIIEGQGGDPRVVDDYSRLPSAPDRDRITATADGVVVGIEAELVGRAAVALGAGRDRLDAQIDPGVGVMIVARPGTRVRVGEPVIEIHHRGGRGLVEARGLLSGAVDIADAAAPSKPLILDRVQDVKRRTA
jgi:pyrimidine-nucleoside phosphorylase